MLVFIRSIRDWVKQPDFKDQGDNQSAFYIQMIAAIVILVAMIVIIVYAIAGNISFILLLSPYALVQAVVISLVRYKKLNFSKGLSLLSSLVMLTLGILFGGGIHAAGSILFPVILIFASLILGRKYFIGYAVLCILSVGVVIFTVNARVIGQNTSNQTGFPLFISFSLILITAAIFIRFITENLQNSLFRARQNALELAAQKVILDHVGQAVVGCDKNTNILYWNKAAVDLSGLNPEEVLGKKFLEIFPDMLSGIKAGNVDALLRQNHVWSGELFVPRRDGSIIPIIGTIAAIMDDQAKLNGWVGIATELTDLKRTQADLIESEAKFHSFFSRSMDAMFLIDENGLVTELNLAAETLFELKRQDAIGKSIWRLQADRVPQDRRNITTFESIRAIGEESLKNGQAPWLNKVIEADIQLPSGKLSHIQQTAFAIPHGDKFRIGSITRDMTESKSAEVYRLQTESELRTASLRQRLLDFSRDLLSTVDTGEILEIIRTTTNELVPYETFSPYWLDESAGGLIPIETQGRNWFGISIFKNWPIPLGEGILGNAAREHQGGWINNAHLDPRSIYPPGILEQIHREHTIYLPIRSTEKMIGMVAFIRHDLPPYTQNDFEQIQLLMSLAELALSNARTFSGLEQRVVERTGELVSREEQYRNFVENSSEGIWLLGFDEPIPLDLPAEMQVDLLQKRGFVSECNEVLARMYGYSRREDFIGKRLLQDLYGGKVPEINKQSTLKLVREGYRSSNRLTEEVNEKGKRVYFLNNAVGVIKDNQLTGLWGMQRDVTEIKLTELREQHRRDMLEKVLQLGKDISQVTNLDECMLKIRLSVQKDLEFDRVGLFFYDAVQQRIQGTLGTLPNGEVEDTSYFSEAVTKGSTWNKALQNPNGMCMWDDRGTDYLDERMHPDMIGVKQNLTVSAWAGEIPIAFISADNLMTQRPFDPIQIEALQLFAGYAGLAISNARWNESLKRRIADLVSIDQVSQTLVSQPDLVPLIQTVGEQIRDMFSISALYIGLLDPTSNQIIFYYQSEDGKTVEATPLQLGQGMTSRVMELRHPILINSNWMEESAKYNAIYTDNPPKATLSVPLLLREEAIGVISLQEMQRENVFTEDHIRQLSTIAANLAVAIDNARLREKLRQQSIRDLLTNLYNRRYLDETLEREIKRAERNQNPLSVILFDIDDFKVLNDTFGHDAGDIVLFKLSELIRAHTRSSDIACRYGGEEFVIILADTSLRTAAERAELLRIECENMALEYEGKHLGKVTLSFGVAAFPQHGLDGRQVMKAADEATYLSKKAGKNRISIAI